MKIKLYTHRLKIDISDDIPKFKEFMTRKIKETSGVDVSFEFDIEETNVILSEVSWKLFAPLQGKYEYVGYMFDRGMYNVANSYAWSPNKDLFCMTLSTSTYDDKVGGTWMNLAHEFIHLMMYKVRSLGKVIVDPMDSMLVNGVPTPYYKNWQPESIDGNFHTAFKNLAPHIKTIFNIPPEAPQAPINDVLNPTVEIHRHTQFEATYGNLTAKNNGKIFKCHTLELGWKNNARNISCIPTGTYKCKWSFSPKFMKYTYEVLNVPNRSGIRIHSGTYALGFKPDIQGCILLGSHFTDVNGDKKIDIVNSRVTIKAFEDFMGKKEFTLIIK